MLVAQMVVRLDLDRMVVVADDAKFCLGTTLSSVRLVPSERKVSFILTTVPSGLSLRDTVIDTVEGALVDNDDVDNENMFWKSYDWIVQYLARLALIVVDFVVPPQQQ